MKKIFPLFIVLFVFISVFSFGADGGFSSLALEIGKEAKVVVSRCEIYSQASFTSEKIVVLIDEQEKPLYLNHGTIVEVIAEETDFVKIKCNENIEGYVYKFYLTQNTSQTVYPVFNGRIRNDTIIYDMDFIDSGFIAKANSQVFIYKSYNEKKDFTAIQIVLDDQSLYNGYVLTKDVNPNGISALLITGISIIIAAVTVVLSVVFIKKRKKNK